MTAITLLGFAGIGMVFGYVVRFIQEKEETQ